MVLSQLSLLIIGGDVKPKSIVRLMRDGDELAIIAGTPDEVADEATKIAASRPAPAGQPGATTAGSGLESPPVAPAGV